MILDALKKSMYRENDKAPGRWIKELPTVVWGLQTQPSRNTGVSPYFMVYGAEAVLPADIEFRSPRVKNYNEDQVIEQCELEVNSAEERRLHSCIRMAKYLAVLQRYYNKNIQERFFVVGDLVLKWKTSQDGVHELATPWEGPYIVKAVTRPTSYRLARFNGTDVPNSIHITSLDVFTLNSQLQICIFFYTLNIYIYV
jgi:hypothetical protein